MYQKAADVLDKLPAAYPHELLPEIREEFLIGNKTVVVFDDDPTGTQTCHDVVVLTTWSIALLTDELNKKPSILFILTNSRSMTEQKAVELNVEIGKNLKEAATISGRGIVVISRSDSTLRGHFPAEVDAISSALQLQRAVWILIPAFIEGGRFTIDDVHYILEQGELIPVSETAFAKDSVFGYQHSNLMAWAEEKSKGKIKRSEMVSCSLEEIRLGGPNVVAEKLMSCTGGNIVVYNALSYRDLEVLAMAILKAEKAGKQFLYRSSATFVSIRAGIAPGHLVTLAQKDFGSDHGSLTIVGSYVPKTTSQLAFLLEQKKHKTIEVDVNQLLLNQDEDRVHTIVRETNEWIASGKDVVIYTSRELKTGVDHESSLNINGAVSAFLVAIVGGLTVSPSFIIAKGGITSSDVASKGLSAASALILGQAIAGVPVWKLSPASKFPEIIYVVFPGNVGDNAALWNVWNKFKSLSQKTGIQSINA